MKSVLKSLQRSDWMTGAAFAAVVTAIMWVLGDWANGMMMGVLLTVGVAATRRRYLDVLGQRLASASGQEWDVRLNGARVGTIKDAQYAAIRAEVFGGQKVYGRQMLNLVTVSANSTGWAVIWLLAIACALAALGMVFEFKAVDAMVFQAREAMRTNALPIKSFGLETIALAWAWLCEIYMLVGLVVAGTSVTAFDAMGFTDHFEEATATKLRDHLGLAIPGRLVLTRTQDGVVHYNHEVAYLKANRAL